MVDIVKPPCSSIIIHDFYTYPHLLFVDIKYSHVDKCVKKNESHWDNSLYIHIKYIENHCKIKDINHFSMVIQSIKIIDLYPLYNSCIYILFNCIYHNKILKHTYPYILYVDNI